jgi:cysteine desulfurase
MAVQNETGVVQDLAGARDLARASNALWLCDATQAIGALDLRQYVVGWDLLSCSSHKLGGPPGVGLLAGPGLVQLDAVLTGGPQEGERRAGTQPVAFIEAFVQALTFAVEEREQRRRHLMELQDAFLARLAALGVAPERNGDPSITLPGFMNLGFAPMDGADLVIGLDAAGCSVSSGSACATGVMEPSAALRAMFPEDEARVRRAIRITLGPENTLAEVQQLAEVIAGLLKSQPRNAP